MSTEVPNDLVFVPLGGTEEIGMNFNLYGLRSASYEDWIIVDLGITFGDDTMPGVEIVVPDASFAQEKREYLHGIILTHGHEDHLGAVPYLWDQLRCPVYATPFTAALLRKKIHENTGKSDFEIIEVPLKGKFDIGPFSVELLSLTHSMPEPNGLAIRTHFGTIFHTGDWKFDPEPVIGEISDSEALTKLGDEGVLACIGDSTNVFVEGKSGSEASLKVNLTKLIGKCEGKVAVTCFASNVARLKTIYEAAADNGRAICLVGRSLWRINAAARETGYLSDLPSFLEAEETLRLPDDEILFVCTGSQGEPRAALRRIAAGNHKNIKFGEGDTVIFSSRIIPGNELPISRLHNQLVTRGIEVVSTNNDEVHVSGHPAQEELVEMYQFIRPEISVPVHGEQRHLKKHIEIAKECQVPQTILANNGSIIRLAPGGVKKIDQAKVGRYSIEGGRMHSIEGEVVRDRNRIIYNGTATITLVVDKYGNICDSPQLAGHALFDEEEKPYILENLIKQLEENLHEISEENRQVDSKIAEVARITIRKSFRITHRKNPLVDVHVVRLNN